MSFLTPTLGGRPYLKALATSQLGRFLAVGMAGLAVDVAVFSLLHEAGLPRAAARALSLAVATAVTWSLNRAFTFAASGRRRRIEVTRYALVVLVAQSVSYCTFLAVSAAAPHLPAVAALLIGAATATGASFGGQRFFTFAILPPQPRGT